MLQGLGGVSGQHGTGSLPEMWHAASAGLVAIITVGSVGCRWAVGVHCLWVARPVTFFPLYVTGQRFFAFWP